MSLNSIAREILDEAKPVTLIFAFNATGKTRLSVEYKNKSKTQEGAHAGVYYNAYSEDLFVWYNDEENNNDDVRLVVNPSSLNKFFPAITEPQVEAHLSRYNPKYRFRFRADEKNPENTIRAILFFEENENNQIKISRGEEKIFVWCFFLALFETPGWADVQSEHIFIDDPVSSLDDYNLHVTAESVCELIDEHFEEKNMIVTTHHFGFFMAVYNFLKRSEKSGKFKDKVKVRVLADRGDGPYLKSFNKSPVLAHLRALQQLNYDTEHDRLEPHHFMRLRQVLETISSFLGSARISHVVEQIGIANAATTADRINALSHKKVFQYEPEELVGPDKDLMEEVLSKLQEKYDFVTHN